jgi:hypothetical protein
MGSDNAADANYRAYVKGPMRSIVAKSIGRDVGNLSWFEQKGIEDNTPSLFDSKQGGLKKIANLQSLVESMKEARRQGYKDLEAYLKVNPKANTFGYKVGVTPQKESVNMDKLFDGLEK